jgi:hypothetical protein
MLEGSISTSSPVLVGLLPGVTVARSRKDSPLLTVEGVAEAVIVGEVGGGGVGVQPAEGVGVLGLRSAKFAQLLSESALLRS